ncbi:MAG: [FeFe] hydrogenase, group A [Candidatus Bathyarchaeota archaeon]|nr:[FeFe] hydrogenase, group A [Candidatus Bathyarchaeota archaeon]
MQVTINKKIVQIPDNTSILEAIESVHETVLSPDLGDAKDWVRNPSCPLMGLAEVDGKLVSLPALKKRLAMDGMSILTHSPKAEEAVAERAHLLTDHHECYFMNEWQKKIAIEGVNAGFITQEEYEQFSFPERGAKPSIVHDPNRCIRCQACVETCRLQGVEALKFDEETGVIVDEERCVRCGQCILHCPVGAITNHNPLAEFLNCEECAFTTPPGAMREHDNTFKVWNLLQDPNAYCVAEFAPAVRASLGEEFDIPAGELVTEKIYAALRRLGFKKIWDTNFAADLTIMEEGTEFIDRFANGGVLPLFTSCCPAWVRFAERFYPELLPHISSAKSPQQMFGAVAKTFGAKSLNVTPQSMRVTSIMPCTSKKTEAKRPEMNSASTYWKKQDGGTSDKSFQDVDVVLTSRELARLLKLSGIDLRQMPKENADPLLGSYTGAAPIFGRTGGVMEAALRTAITLLSGKPPANLEFNNLASLDGIKRGEILIGGKVVKVAVAHGLDNIRKVCESVLLGGEFSDYHFIEFMACPGGCIGGGGQPLPTNVCTRKARTTGLNRDDSEVCDLRMSHENPEIKALYEEFLEKPLSHTAHQLLHTRYTAYSLRD